LNTDIAIHQHHLRLIQHVGIVIHLRPPPSWVSWELKPVKEDRRVAHLEAAAAAVAAAAVALIALEVAPLVAMTSPWASACVKVTVRYVCKATSLSTAWKHS